jgi:serine/threonine protein kinase
MSWPRATDYQEAMQFPALSLADSAIAGAQVESGPLGLPRVISGNFASVYQLQRDGQRWALRCFLAPGDDRQDRYRIIAKHLAKRCPDCLSGFDYLPQGLLVHGQHYPALRMPWVEGRTLGCYIAENLKNTAALADLETRWLELLRGLKRAQIAHGDLQHGNILVHPDGSLHLIDYDGMWVPGLAGRFATELGHPNYQAPSRDASHFHGDLDAFAGRLIHISLRAIALQPKLWKTYHNEGNLIFTREDLEAPEASALFAELAAIGDRTLDRELAALLRALRQATSPALSESPRSRRPLFMALSTAALVLLTLAFWPASKPPAPPPAAPPPVEQPPPLPKSAEQLSAESRAENFRRAYAKADQEFLGKYAGEVLERLEATIANAETRAEAGEWQAASAAWDHAVTHLADAISAAVANSARIAPPVSRPRPPPSPPLSPEAQAAKEAAQAYETLLAETDTTKLSGAPWYFAQQTAKAAEVAHAAGNHAIAAKKWQEAAGMIRALTRD